MSKYYISIYCKCCFPQIHQYYRIMQNQKPNETKCNQIINLHFHNYY